MYYMETMPNTPGYNCHLKIEFTYDKNGRKLAHYTAPRAGFRRFRVSTTSAELWIAQGLATETTLLHLDPKTGTFKGF
jgi:hypothetical protein